MGRARELVLMIYSINMKFAFITLLIVLFFGLFFSTQAEASCRREATVKYQTRSGWSKSYAVKVNFMSGNELNQATNSLDYSSFSVYAIIFWGENQVSVIKLKGPLLCGSEVTCSCIDNTVFDLQGYDQKSDKWNICLGDLCF